MTGNNKYEYKDPDYVYTDPATGTLRNKLSISEHGILQDIESFEVGRRLEELENKPLKIKSSYSLLTIHDYLFQDLYDWAGKVRTVQISKEGKPFLPTDRFSEGFSYINDLITEYWNMDDDVYLLSKQLAVILDAINFLHPFREGNGRTQREFIRILALEKSYRLGLNPADDKTVYDKYMQGTIEGDIELLASLIESIIEKT